MHSHSGGECKCCIDGHFTQGGIHNEDSESWHVYKMNEDGKPNILGYELSNKVSLHEAKPCPGKYGYMSCPDISEDKYIGMALEGSVEPYT